MEWKDETKICGKGRGKVDEQDQRNLWLAGFRGEACTACYSQQAPREVRLSRSSCDCGAVPEAGAGGAFFAHAGGDCRWSRS